MPGDRRCVAIHENRVGIELVERSRQNCALRGPLRRGKYVLETTEIKILPRYHLPETAIILRYESTIRLEYTLTAQFWDFATLAYWGTKC